MKACTDDASGHSDALHPIAHVRRTSNGGWAEPHLLEEHLQGVASRSEKFASSFENGDWGHIAGLWHDLGKYRDEFANYIRNASGYEFDLADDGGPGKVDHTAAGAIHAVERLGPRGRVLAYLNPPDFPGGSNA